MKHVGMALEVVVILVVVVVKIRLATLKMGSTV